MHSKFRVQLFGVRMISVVCFECNLLCSPALQRKRVDMKSDYAGTILRSLRRIIRSIDQHNKQLSREYQLTVPQLICLRQLLASGEMTPGKIAEAVFLSQATVTGILDRLEAKELINRERSTVDRRKLLVNLTDSGRRLAVAMPWPLQERFAESLSSLGPREQRKIDEMLGRIALMMEAPSIPVWPFGGSSEVTPNQIKTPEDRSSRYGSE